MFVKQCQHGGAEFRGVGTVYDIAKRIMPPVIVFHRRMWFIRHKLIQYLRYVGTSKHPMYYFPGKYMSALNTYSTVATVCDVLH